VTQTWNTDHDMTADQAKAEKAAADQLLWAVRDAMRAAGTVGLTTVELYRIGTSAVRRLNELKRQHGFDYRRTYVSRGVWRYVLIEPADVVKPAAKPRVIDRLLSEAARRLGRAGAEARRRSTDPAEPHPVSLF
jgi:hypothetical protein